MGLQIIWNPAVEENVSGDFMKRPFSKRFSAVRDFLSGTDKAALNKEKSAIKGFRLKMGLLDYFTLGIPKMLAMAGSTLLALSLMPLHKSKSLGVKLGALLGFLLILPVAIALSAADYAVKVAAFVLALLPACIGKKASAPAPSNLPGRSLETFNSKKAVADHQRRNPAPRHSFAPLVTGATNGGLNDLRTVGRINGSTSAPIATDTSAGKSTNFVVTFTPNHSAPREGLNIRTDFRTTGSSLIGTSGSFTTNIRCASK